MNEREHLRRQEYLRRVDHRVDALREAFLSLIEATKVTGVRLTLTVTEEHTDINLALNEPQETYPRTTAVSIQAD